MILFLIVGLVVGGTFVGYQYFAQMRVESSRDVMQNEVAFTGEEAIKYYNLPVESGGGGKSFLGFKPSRRSRRPYSIQTRPVNGTLMWETSNGSYSYISLAADSMILEGVGDLKGIDKVNPVRVGAVVKRDGNDFRTLN